MFQKHFRIIIGCLLLVFILSSVGIYIHFSRHKASDIREETCDEFVDLIHLSNLSPDFRNRTEQRGTATRPDISEDTGGFSVTGVGGLTFYYTRSLTAEEQTHFEAHKSNPNNPHKRPEVLKMSIISFYRPYKREKIFGEIMQDLVALRITADQAESRLMDFYQAKYIDKPIDPIITTAPEHLRTDSLLYTLEAYQQYLYWYNVTRYHGFSLMALEIVSATLQVEWHKNKQRMCKAALSLAEEAGFSLYKRMTDGASLVYLPLSGDRVRKAAARLVINYESKEVLVKGRVDNKRQVDEKKAQMKQLIKNQDAAYSHYVAHAEAFNNRTPSDDDNITVVQKRSIPKLLLDTINDERQQ